MTPDSDTYRAVSLMLKYFGTNASYQAALKADTLNKKGNKQASAAWERIYGAINDFLSTDAPPKSQLN